MIHHWKDKNSLQKAIQYAGHEISRTSPMNDSLVCIPPTPDFNPVTHLPPQWSPAV